MSKENNEIKEEVVVEDKAEKKGELIFQDPDGETVCCGLANPRAFRAVQSLYPESNPAGDTLAIFSVKKETNFDPDYIDMNRLRKGFINTNINPFTGEPLNIFNDDTRSIFNLAPEYLPAAPIRSADDYQPENIARDMVNVHNMRSILRSHFTAYAYHAISQMINFANAQLANYLLKNVFTGRDADSVYRRYIATCASICYSRYDMDKSTPTDLMPKFFDPEIFLGYRDGYIGITTSFLNSIPRAYWNSEDKVDVESVGSLLNIDYYVVNDLGVVLSTLIPCLEHNMNKVVNLANGAADSVYYDAFLTAYNKYAILLLSALENVVCELVAEARRLYEVGGPGLVGAPYDVAKNMVVYAVDLNEIDTTEATDAPATEENDK